MTGLQVAIIADDLTGALDSAAPFAAMGLRVVVATGLEGLALTGGADVVAVSLSSREIAVEAAAARAGAAARALVGAEWLFKKIDSRLKGHVAAEVAAVAQVRGATAVLACPAVPDLGRIVVKGALTGAGVERPIPVAPVFAPLAVECPDVANASDLDALIAGASPATLLVGARGLAAALARRLAKGATATPRLPGPLAILVGSRDPITLAQVNLARQEPGVEWIAAPDGLVPDGASQADTLILQAVPGAGASGVEVSGRLAEALPRHLAGRLGLLITGGETAGAVLAQLGIQALEVRGEVLPGLPLCRPLGAMADLTIVTKSGGFGDASALQHLIRQAKGTLDVAQR
jgi:D-threonate/D-erythronate kinase